MIWVVDGGGSCWLRVLGRDTETLQRSRYTVHMQLFNNNYPTKINTIYYHYIKCRLALNNQSETLTELWTWSSTTFKAKNAKWFNSRFCCMWAFWFPHTKSLDDSSATWNMTHHPLFCTCDLLSQPAPYGPCCLQTPESLSLGQGLFLWEPLHCSSSSEEWGDDDEQSQPEQTFCFKFWQDIQQLTGSALLAQLLIHASWQSGGNNYEWWKDWK